MSKPSPNNLSEQFRHQEGQGHSNGNKPSWNKEPVENPIKHYYGIETGNRHVRRFKLMMRSGKVVSIPYAYLPVIVLTEDKQLVICTHDVEVIIKGRNLQKMEEWLNEERVIWIRESITNFDTGDSDVFVSDILIKGEWLH